MHLNYMKPQIVSRGKGQSVIQRAAYNNRCQLRNERTGELTDNYAEGKDRDDLVWSRVFAPQDAPEWVQDRERLWNEVDAKSKRWDAQLARDFKIPLPAGLPREHQVWLATDFGLYLSGHGMVADMNIHDKGDGNPHLHLLTTMRKIGPDGFGNVVPEWNDQGLDKCGYKVWHAKWSELGAKHLDRCGLHAEAERFRNGHLPREQQQAESINREDYEYARKLENEPHKHMGQAAHNMEKEDGILTRKGDINREIDERNYARTKPRVRENPWRVGKQLIWDEWGKKADPVEFRNALRDQGYLLARVSKEEAAQSIKDHAAAKETGGYSPKLYAGEYVFVDEGSRIFRLTPETTGAKTFKDINEYMKPLDQTSAPTLTKTVEFMEMRPEIIAKERRQQRQSPGHDHRKPASIRKERGLPGRLSRVAERQVGATLDMIGGALNVLAPVLTPKQKAEGRQADKQKEFAGKEADRAREEAARMAENERRWGGQGRDR